MLFALQDLDVCKWHFKDCLTLDTALHWLKTLVTDTWDNIIKPVVLVVVSIHNLFNFLHGRFFLQPISMTFVCHEKGLLYTSNNRIYLILFLWHKWSRYIFPSKYSLRWRIALFDRFDNKRHWHDSAKNNHLNLNVSVVVQ